MALDLATFAIVTGAAFYLAWRWIAGRRRRAACDGCGPASAAPTTHRVSLAQLQSTLRR